MTHRAIPCRECGTLHALEWHCVNCLVNWMAPMSRDEQIQHARVIAAKAGQAMVDKVSQALILKIREAKTA